jgi:hypothetical protein
MSQEEKQLELDFHKDFLELQHRELDARISAQESEQAFARESLQLAKQQLTIEATDREKERTFLIKKQFQTYIFSASLVVLIIIFGCYALFLNKEQIVLEVVKLLGAFLTGAAGGYAYGKQQKTKGESVN